MKRLVTPSPKGWNPDAVHPHTGDAYQRSNVRVGQKDGESWRGWLLVALALIAVYFGMRVIQGW